MKVPITRSAVYVPKWRGNRDLPEVEQIRIEYRLLTAEQEERFSSIAPEYENDGKEVKVTRIKVETHANAIWAENVVKVFNFVGDDGKPVENPIEVQKIPGVYGLITEVVAQIKRGIDEDQARN